MIACARFLLFLSPNQQRQSTERIQNKKKKHIKQLETYLFTPMFAPAVFHYPVRCIAEDDVML